MAHRGITVKSPENTISSYKEAIEAGFNAIELDILQTKDEELKGARILETLKNRFGGAGHIAFLLLRKEGFKELAIVQNSNS